MLTKDNILVHLLGITFLLFPIAHFKISVLGLPFYLAEIPLLTVTGIIFWKAWKEEWEWKETIQENKVFFIGVDVFLIGAVLSYAMNEHTLTGLGMLKSFFFLPTLFAFLMIVRVKTREDGERILWLWLAGLAMMAWTSLILIFHGGLTYDLRLAGGYASPNYLAMLVAPGALLSMYFFLTTTKTVVKKGSSFFFCITLLVLLLTQSYVSFAALLGAMMFFLWINRCVLSWPWKKILVLGILSLLFLLAFLFSAEKFQTLVSWDERSSLTSRFMIWEAAGKIAKDTFPLGIGPGNFQEKYLAYQKYFPLYLEWAVPQPHNLYLSLLLQAGTLGLVGFLFLLISLLKRVRQVWHEKSLAPEQQAYGALLISLLLFYLLVGLFDTPYFKNDLAFALWGVIGLMFAWVREKVRD